MSLRSIIASFDDDALVALANKGLLRRARIAVGDANLVQFTDDEARAVVDGHQVSIPATGPQSATCDCPAPGMCSHILTAMLVIRNDGDRTPKHDTKEQPTESTASESTPQISAVGWLAAIDAQVLRKFAGADYPGATSLAATAEVQGKAATAQVRFTSPEASVTFVAEQPLKDALYKGPTTRRRLVITAAALAIRDREGVVRDAVETTGDPDKITAPTGDTLTDISAAIEAAMAQVFLGSAALAQERFLDLAISAKIQSAPRLTSQLLMLSSQAGWAGAGDVRFEGGRFLVALAQAYALVLALKQNSDDPALLGISRRNYEPAPAMDLWALGAKGWTTPNGARGLTLYLLNPDTGDYHAATVARAAGMDATFTPSRAYSSPIWGTASFPALTGRKVTLDAPHLASDGQLSTSAKTVAKVRGSLTRKTMLESSAVCTDWEELLEDLQKRMGTGLLRGAAPLPSLIAPTSIEEPQFDDISQLYRWQVRDKSGNTISLSARPQDMEHLKSLHTQFPGAAALLVLSSIAHDEIKHEAVTLLHPKGETIEATNLDFMPAPGGNLMARAKGGIRRGLRKLQGEDFSALQSGFAAQVLSHLAEQCRHRQPDALDRLAKEAEARQLLLLADSLEKLRNHPHPSSYLAVAYLCSELVLIDSFRASAT